MKTIDLNCDMGELPAMIADGTQETLMASVTSVSIACGGHGGDDATMRATVEQALRLGVAIGAHPGYADRANFGRIELRLAEDELEQSIYEQVCALAKIAQEFGATVRHVKPHGALYNQAARDLAIARAIARGVARWRRDIVLVGLAGSAMLDLFRSEGFRVTAEAFADRLYEADGSLRARKFSDALIEDPAHAARQAVGIAERGFAMAANGSDVKIDAQTLCIHGDTPGAAAIACAVASALRAAGLDLRPMSDEPQSR
jgi:UPF0271 protein